jgi:2-polyprenyl-3-methyl-5-hydroxy-6-metoxy-1,4-benzoquinol methylase
LNSEKTPIQIYGNYEDKYKSKNPISRFLVSNFIRTFKNNLRTLPSGSVTSICEVGCAEGELLKLVHEAFPLAALFACDISEDEILKARQNCKPIPINYSIQNAERLQQYNSSEFDLVICCEVLEHLQNPAEGLQELFRIAKTHILVSVPNEPIWRILNLARAKYIQSLGNTPGHLNHWSPIQFSGFLRTNPGWSIIKRTYPLPWQMVLLKKISF